MHELLQVLNICNKQLLKMTDLIFIIAAISYNFLQILLENRPIVIIIPKLGIDNLLYIIITVLLCA